MTLLFRRVVVSDALAYSTSEAQRVQGLSSVTLRAPFARYDSAAACVAASRTAEASRSAGCVSACTGRAAVGLQCIGAYRVSGANDVVDGIGGFDGARPGCGNAGVVCRALS
ncbi:hypothetical protein MRX96_041023 [Rhipicephalus microplus]